MKKILLGIVCAGMCLIACNKEPELPPRSLEFKVYPNPTSGVLNITSYMTTGTTKKLTIYDMDGKLITSADFTATFTGSNLYEEDLTDRPAGHYLVTLESGSGKLTAKVIKK